MTTCRECEAWLASYLGAELTGSTLEDFETHLAASPACREEARKLEAVFRATQALVDPEPPERLMDELRGQASLQAADLSGQRSLTGRLRRWFGYRLIVPLWAPAMVAATLVVVLLWPYLPDKDSVSEMVASHQAAEPVQPAQPSVSGIAEREEASADRPAAAPARHHEEALKEQLDLAQASGDGTAAEGRSAARDKGMGAYRAPVAQDIPSPRPAPRRSSPPPPKRRLTAPGAESTVAGEKAKKQKQRRDAEEPTVGRESNEQFAGSATLARTPEPEEGDRDEYAELRSQAAAKRELSKEADVDNVRQLEAERMSRSRALSEVTEAKAHVAKDKLSTKDAESLLETAENAERAGKLDAAIKLYETVAERHPEPEGRAGALVRMAAVLRQQGRHEAEVVALRRASELDAEHASMLQLRLDQLGHANQ